MSQSEELRRIANGVANFSNEMKYAVDRMNENIGKVLTRHYQANHTPYAVMSFEDEAHYWEETLAYSINAVLYPGEANLDVEYLSQVPLLNRVSYVIIRGLLKSGNTIRYDETKLGQLYINGKRYTGNYTFNGETPETYEKLVVVAVQTRFNLGIKYYGDLEMPVSDFPIENAEIFVNIGKYTDLQPVIEELLEDETVESFYIKGDWTWACTKHSYIKTLKTLDSFRTTSDITFAAPQLFNYIIPNSLYIPANSRPQSIRNVDMSNAGGIYNDAFVNSLICGDLYITNTGGIGENAFSNCRFITAVYIGDGIISIGANAFQNCTALRKVVIGDNVTTIGANAFSSNSNIKELHLGKSITTINISALAMSWQSLDNFTVSKGYHCATTTISQNGYPTATVPDIFLNVVKNCANIGEDGRTASTMTFKVASSVRTAITNAYNAGDEKALELYDLMAAKSITITT